MFSCTDDPGSSVGQLKLCCVGCVACANTWLHEGAHAQPPQPQPHEPTVKRSLPGPSLQWLNVGIFKAIGHAGVYYGFKLGHTVPWVSGFPFNVVSHPQYVGSVATVLGGAALVSPKLPGSLVSAVLSSELQPCLSLMQHGSKVPAAKCRLLPCWVGTQCARLQAQHGQRAHQRPASATIPPCIRPLLPAPTWAGLCRCGRRRRRGWSCWSCTGRCCTWPQPSRRTSVTWTELL